MAMHGCIVCSVCGGSCPLCHADLHRHGNTAGDLNAGAYHELADDKLRTENASLRIALADALEGLVEMRSYVPKYFATKHGHDRYIERAQEALKAMP